jgi:hypothetical protein
MKDTLRKILKKDADWEIKKTYFNSLKIKKSFEWLYKEITYNEKNIVKKKK